MTNLRLFFAIILIFFGFTKCQTEMPIPEVHVNFTIYLSNPIYNDLNSVGNSVYVPNQGYKGIIITRSSFDTFKAYDASCTYNPDDRKAIVKIKEVSGVCDVCGSQYNLLLTGYVEKGPATAALKNYGVKFNRSAQTLYVYN